MAAVYRRIEGARPLVSERVEAIKSSIARVGQLNPIHVRRCTRTDGPKKIDAYEIIAGGHRFEAMWQLNRETISAVVLDEDSVQQRLVEIAENLHRAELTALERSEQIAEWVDLTGDSFAHVAQNPKGGRPGVLSAAVRELGIDRTDAQRSVKVANLHPEAKSVAVAVGLDDNRAALLEAAREKTPQAQVAVLHGRAERRQRPVSPARDALNDIEVLERQVEALMTAWNKASKEAREEFLLRVDTPVFDKSRVA
jgi:ParB family chromosome partitioning protein